MHDAKRTRKARMAGVGIAAAVALGGGAVLATAVSAQGTATPGVESFFRANTTPTRVLDTRTGVGAPQAPIGPGETITLDLTSVLTGFGPANAVVVNVGVEGPSEQSYIALLPFDAPPGTTSSLNFAPGQTIANQATVALVDGKIDVFNATGTTEVFIDLVGVFTTIL